MTDGAAMAPTIHSDSQQAGPKFARDRGFQRELRRRVAEYFEDAGRSPFGDGRMKRKTAILLLWFLSSYLLMVFVAATWWQGALCVISLALAGAGIGFSIQHDANHGSYSRSRLVNGLLGLTLDLLGGSSYIWRQKHNVAHHTYTNIAGADNDVDLLPWARLCPSQRRRAFHGFQQYYLFLLYGFLHPNWQVLDLQQVISGKIAGRRFRRPRGADLARLILGKLFFITWAFVIPAFFHPWWALLLGYALASAVIGIVLGVVFQLAHCVEGPLFPEPPPPGVRQEASWAAHQVQTTINIGGGSRALTWYIGGLNFQIEHHLFPKVCHIHYRSLAKIVREVCAEFDLDYRSHPGFFAAVASHFRWLKRMGQPQPTP